MLFIHVLISSEKIRTSNGVISFFGCAPKAKPIELYWIVFTMALGWDR
jgi:hypothetical protein